MCYLLIFIIQRYKKNLESWKNLEFDNLGKICNLKIFVINLEF